MTTLRKLKLREYEKNEVTLDELKEALIRYYYPKVYQDRPDLFEQDMARKMIVTEIKGNHGTTSSVVFSVNGSPPKGEAILFLHGDSEDEWVGSLIVMGNGRISNRVAMLRIKKPHGIKLGVKK